MSETTTAMPGAATEPVEVIDAESAAGLAEATAAMGRRPVDLAVLAMVAASHQSCGESVRVSPGAADEDATVLARLLALDASGEDTRTLVDDEERACWALERTAGGAVVVRRPPGAAPLVGIRATVPPLATELVCQLVAAGDEGWGKPFPRPGEVRRRARLEQEASAAETLVHDWLGLDDVPGEGTTRESWWHRMGGSDDLTLLRDTWFDWLVARGSMREVGGLLTSRPDRPAPVAVTDPTVRDLGRRLAAHRDLVLRVLTGRAPSADLLDVPSLRPSRLMAEEPALAALWEELAVLVLARARELPDRRLVVVDVGGVGADNDILRRAMDVAGADHVEVPAGRPPHPQVEADVVLAIGALHRWADPAEAARAVREMLAPQGLLVAVEQTEMSGLGLLVAGLLDGGFVDPRGRPRGTPVHPRDTWLTALRDAGVSGGWVRVGPAPAVVMTAHVDDLAGRTDRHRGTSSPAGAPEPGTQTELARLWGELLPEAPTDRGDSFFELGGDSLAATRLLTLVRRRFGVTLTMRDLFADPRLVSVARRIDEGRHPVPTSQRSLGLEEGVL